VNSNRNSIPMLCYTLFLESETEEISPDSISLYLSLCVFQKPTVVFAGFPDQKRERNGSIEA
jgi:hypothetical protein